MSIPSRHLAPGAPLHLSARDPDVGNFLFPALQSAGLDPIRTDMEDTSAPDRGASLFDVTLERARRVAQRTGTAALAAESGVFLPLLGGAPGLDTMAWRQSETGSCPYARLRGRIAAALAAAGRGLPAPISLRTVLCLAWPDGAFRFSHGQLDGILHDRLQPPHLYRPTLMGWIAPFPFEQAPGKPPLHETLPDVGRALDALFDTCLSGHVSRTGPSLPRSAA